jgi:hypothetical protein
MEDYICNTIGEIKEKVKNLELINKREIRHKFQTGKVCNKNEYITNISELFKQLK